ncbi:MAG: hypothetical protein WCL32_17865 [Planctomycetota bacterium]
MSLFVLDTDILTQLERGELSVVEHVRRRSASELATTVITVEQKLAGWYSTSGRREIRSTLSTATNR